MPGSRDELDDLRPLLFSIAYGMTGSVGDAEDLVQDAYLGLTLARTTVLDPKAYLTTAVTRLGINYLGSARVRRETYVGDWLPEPVVVVPADGPEQLADSLSMAFLVLLEALSGRAGRRQDRGQLPPDLRPRRIAAGAPVHPTPRRAEGQELARRFFAAAAGGDVRALLDLLAWINGHPGAILYDDQQCVVSVFELDLAGAVVKTIRAVVNPDKLAHLGVPRPRLRSGPDPEDLTCG